VDFPVFLKARLLDNPFSARFLTINRQLKKLICILFALMVVGQFAFAKEVCSGTSHNVAYTIKGNYVYYSTSSEVAYTIRDEYICSGTSHDIVYTIRGIYICYGTSHDVAYTIRDNRICSGTSQNVAYTIRD